MEFQSVLITGGTGLIGTNLAVRLAAEGHQVTVLGRGSRFAVSRALPGSASERLNVIAGDTADPDTLHELVAGSDVVFHKSESIGIAGAVESARDYVREHLLGTANLVDA